MRDDELATAICYLAQARVVFAAAPSPAAPTATMLDPCIALESRAADLEELLPLCEEAHARVSVAQPGGAGGPLSHPAREAEWACEHVRAAIRELRGAAEMMKKATR